MRIVGATYSDEKMTRSAELCSLSMQKNGVDKVFQANSSWWKAWEYTDTFEWLNRTILQQKRGCGYWLWKPWLIADVINNDCVDGDILIYSDAGIEWLQPVKEIIDRMDQNAFLFTNTHPNHHWTKRYTLDTIKPGWNHNIDKDSSWPQAQASVIILKVCDETRRFVKEWLLWCQMPDIINDVPSPGGEMAYYQEHRHDQSVLTLMADKYNYRLHWWPTAYAEHIRVPGDNYPVMFNHHRKRNAGMGDGDVEWQREENDYL